jgi:hypothetical protein
MDPSQALETRKLGRPRTHVHLQEVPILCQLDKEILVEAIKVRLELLGRHVLSLGCVDRVVVDIGEEDGLGVLRVDVFS